LKNGKISCMVSVLCYFSINGKQLFPALTDKLQKLYKNEQIPQKPYQVAALKVHDKTCHVLYNIKMTIFRNLAIEKLWII